MRVTFLGTGTSHGVPTIDCMLQNYARCPRKVCLKAEGSPRYRRTLASILVETGRSSLLIDTSQDFREQMLANRIRRVDAVLFTHSHADHIYGLPDIRSYCRYQKGAIPIYGSQETLEIIGRSFGYVFHPPDYVGGGIPRLIPQLLDSPLQVCGTDVAPLPVEHGPLRGCQGYRIGDMAYVPDVKVIPAASLAGMQGLDLLILNCLRLRTHGSHLSLSESLAYVEQLRPRRCLLTHMTHDIDYQLDEGRLPECTHFAHDGLSLQL